MHLRFACITTCTYCTRAADTTLCHTEKNTLWLACPARCTKQQHNSHVKCSLSVKCYQYGISALLHQLLQTLPFEREKSLCKVEEACGSLFFGLLIVFSLLIVLS